MKKGKRLLFILGICAAVIIPMILTANTALPKAPPATEKVKRDYTINVRNVLPPNLPKALIEPLRHIHKSADEAERKFTKGKVFSEYGTLLVGSLAKFIAELIPDRNLPTTANYTPKNLYTGTEVFADEPTATAWRAGYAGASVIPEDVADGGYNLAGYFNNKKCTGVTQGDDQRFNAIALDAGKGTVLFCSLDGFGLTGTDIRYIRSLLEDFAKEKGIIGINISCTHSHYCLDIHGTGTNMGDLFKKNFSLIPSGKTAEISPKNQKLMDKLFAVGKETVIQAVNNMESGKLFYNETDIFDLIGDKQLPEVFDPNVHRFRFIPDNPASKEIWLINMAVHPTTMGGDTTTVSADYPGRIVKLAREQYNANAAFFQGAEAAITRKTDGLGIKAENTDVERITIYAAEILKRITANTNETLVDPILNFRAREIYLEVDNPLMTVFLKLQFANNGALTQAGRPDEVSVITEIGYCEIGKNLAVVLLPCELSAEIAFGGTRPANEAWNKTEWPFPSMESMTGGRELLAFGLMNDQFGYVVPDNDHAVAFADMLGDVYKFSDEKNDHYEELLSVGPQTASTMMREYGRMLESIR